MAQPTPNPSPNESSAAHQVVVDRLIEAQDALRSFSQSFGRGEPVVDLAQAADVVRATQALEAAVLLSLASEVTPQELGEHLGTNSVGVRRRITNAHQLADQPAELAAPAYSEDGDLPFHLQVRELLRPGPERVEDVAGDEPSLY